MVKNYIVRITTMVLRWNHSTYFHYVLIIILIKFPLPEKKSASYTPVYFVGRNRQIVAIVSIDK
jgi:hypothetical protein